MPRQIEHAAALLMLLAAASGAAPREMRGWHGWLVQPWGREYGLSTAGQASRATHEIMADGVSGQTLPAAGQPRPWRDEIVYVIIVQKFFNGDPSNDVMARRFGRDRSRYEGGFWGGDLEGIIRKLDYLQSLGATALLLYPVMANDANPIGKYLAPGYRPRDYFHVDENFGDVATLKRLVDQAHRRGLKVLLDLPLGMPGWEHPFLKDPTKRDWLGKPTVWGPPQWDAENPEVAEYLIGVSKFWKEQTGCDGFRLDSAQLHSEKFWKAYADALKRDSKDFLLWAEVPLNPRRIQAFLSATGFDSAYDFSAGIAQDVFGKGESVGKLSFVLHQGQRVYSTPSSLCAQIDSYEDPEFITAARVPKAERMKLAITYLLTLDRVPLLYCGDEAALAFRQVGEIFDPQVQARPALKYTRTLIALRKSEPALREGAFAELPAKDPVYAFLRTAGDSRVAVILNNSDKPQKVGFPLAGAPWREVVLHDLLSKQEVKAGGSDEPIEVEPWGARILKAR